MPIMTHRTTFALDQNTARRLKTLASRWNVSQAEVVRRAVQEAESKSEPIKTNPVDLLRQLHQRGEGLPSKQADKWVKQMREDRKNWRAS